MLDPYESEGLDRLASSGCQAFALELIPRTTRAQSMDVLSSQANIAGYAAVLKAATLYPRFFPMMMTAAGTVKAARVVVLGAGGWWVVKTRAEAAEALRQFTAAYNEADVSDKNPGVRSQNRLSRGEISDLDSQYRQGLRTFSTNYYLSPGRLNEVEVNGVNVIVDYCHNAPGMKMLGDFVDRVGDSLESSHDLARPSRIALSRLWFAVSSTKASGTSNTSSTSSSLTVAR